MTEARPRYVPACLNQFEIIHQHGSGLVRHVLADEDYFSGAEILASHKAEITTTVPRPATSGKEAKGLFIRTDFLYDPECDVYRCPAGNDLIYRYTREEGGLQVRRYWINECQTFPLQSGCTSGKERRIWGIAAPGFRLQDKQT